MVKKCIIGKPVKKDVFTSTLPFGTEKAFTYHLRDVYGVGYTTTDGKQHYSAYMNELGRGNVNIRVCKTKGKGFKRKTPDYGCDESVIDKNTKYNKGKQLVKEFVRDKDLFHLPIKGQEKDIFETVTSPSQKKHFTEEAHCASSCKTDEDCRKKHKKVLKGLKGNWRYTTWGEADQSIPSTSIKKGKNAVEYFEYSKK